MDQTYDGCASEGVQICKLSRTGTVQSVRGRALTALANREQVNQSEGSAYATSIENKNKNKNKKTCRRKGENAPDTRAVRNK